MLLSSGNKAWDYLEGRFGVDREELSFRMEEISGDYWIHTGTEENLQCETRGIRCVRDTGRALKPTTYALQLLEDHIDKSIIEVDKAELIDLLERREMIGRTLDIEEGYVAIMFGERVIGCGMYKDEKISSRIPKGRSKELRKIIEN
ncbi:MAG: hypothetical protein BRC27_01045 [Nanohaloarchaea archaeon SW_10_44_10]|nr:MAG: hypothetical protein BRC27_01045 [Nanohaloarchaea archaeon SW_10_44_10]